MREALGPCFFLKDDLDFSLWRFCLEKRNKRSISTLQHLCIWSSTLTDVAQLPFRVAEGTWHGLSFCPGSHVLVAQGWEFFWIRCRTSCSQLQALGQSHVKQTWPPKGTGKGNCPQRRAQEGWIWGLLQLRYLTRTSGEILKRQTFLKRRSTGICQIWRLDGLLFPQVK